MEKGKKLSRFTIGGFDHSVGESSSRPIHDLIVDAGLHEDHFENDKRRMEEWCDIFSSFTTSIRRAFSSSSQKDVTGNESHAREDDRFSGEVQKRLKLRPSMRLKEKLTPGKTSDVASSGKETMPRPTDVGREMNHDESKVMQCTDSKTVDESVREPRKRKKTHTTSTQKVRRANRLACSREKETDAGTIKDKQTKAVKRSKARKEREDRGNNSSLTVSRCIGKTLEYSSGPRREQKRANSTHETVCSGQVRAQSLSNRSNEPNGTKDEVARDEEGRKRGNEALITLEHRRQDQISIDGRVVKVGREVTSNVLGAMNGISRELEQRSLERSKNHRPKIFGCFCIASKHEIADES